MKKIALMLTVVAVAALLGSCKSKKEEGLRPVQPEQPEYTFTKEDTSAVIDQVNQFLAYLKQKDIKNATEMLWYLDKDSIKELSVQSRVRQARALTFIVGCHDYHLNRIVFNSDIDNEAVVDIVLFEKPEGDPHPNTTTFSFRPVRFEGKWYLTTKDNISDSHSELRNQKPKVGDLEENEDED